jgi:hypothetical protein
VSIHKRHLSAWGGVYTLLKSSKEQAISRFQNRSGLDTNPNRPFVDGNYLVYKVPVCFNAKQREDIMESDKALYVRVKDQTGNEFICPIESLIDPEKATEDELEYCVDDATVGRYAGNIDIVEQGK